MTILKTILEDLFKHGLTVLGTWLVLRFGIPQTHAAALINLAPLLAGIASVLIGLGISILHTSYLKWLAKVGPLAKALDIPSGAVSAVPVETKAPPIAPGAAMVGLGFLLLGFSLAGCASVSNGTVTANTFFSDAGKFTVSALENTTFQKAVQVGLTMAGKVTLEHSNADQATINQMYSMANMFEDLMPAANGTSTPITSTSLTAAAKTWGYNLGDGSDWSDAVNWVATGIDTASAGSQSTALVTTWLGILANAARAAASSFATVVPAS